MKKIEILLEVVFKNNIITYNGRIQINQTKGVN
jgi:hypothetical protein